jgi:putative PEP-CTERM system TPR-repeat lipoprotein
MARDGSLLRKAVMLSQFGPRSPLSLAALSLALLCGAACRTDPKVAKERYLASGNRYAAAGKYAEAVIEYRNALQYDPSAGTVHEKLADALLRTGDPNALREYLRAADLLQDDATLQVKAGDLLLLVGRFDEAKSRAQKVLATDARNIDAQILLANAQAGLKDLDGAIAQIEDALRVDPDRGATYSSLGAIELGRGQREAAERAFTKAVELQPNSVTARLSLGNFYWLTSQTTAAEASLKRALEIDPKNALTNRALANFYLATNRRSDAEQPLKMVYEVSKTPASAFALADYYIAVGNDASARTVLQTMLNTPSASSVANVQLATLDHKGGHREDAYGRLASVLAGDQANLQALLVKSALLLSDGRPDEALASVSTATARHPESASAFFTLGRVQTARRQPAAAIVAFQEVLRLNPRATEAKIALGQLQLAQGRPDTTVGLAVEALANEPANGNAELLFVRGLLAQGELDRAASELKQLMVRFPNSFAVHAQMGMLLGRKQNLAGARAEFERALELQPDAVEPFAGLVALDVAARNYTTARARVDARIATGPTAPLLTLAARVYAASGDLPAAEAFLRQALDKDSAYLAAYGALGQLYVLQNKLDAARAEFERMAERSPKPVAALTMVGIILQAQGDEESARTTFERAMQVDPEAAVAANNLAWIYAEKGGNLDMALQLARTAQKRLPGAAEVGDTLGFIYYKKNLASLAVSTLRVSAAQDPGNATYQYHLGLAYASSGDAPRARQSLTRALALKPDFGGAQDAKNLLSSLGTR